jgi:hypothetical protein
VEKSILKKAIYSLIKMNVLLIVALKQEDFLVWTMSKEIAKHVVKNLLPANMSKQNTAKKVVCVDVKEINFKVEVFNFTVNTEHNYFANGFLVSNCDSFLYLCKYSFAFLEKYNTKEKTGMEKLESDFFDRVIESKQKEEDEWEKFY